MRLACTVITALAVAGATLFIAGSRAHAQDCQALWRERNLYYKNAGFCFKEPRAIAYFGNGGCTFNDVAALPLSRTVRKRIDQIVKAEQKQGCK
jgi:YARHG domain